MEGTQPLTTFDGQVNFGRVPEIRKRGAQFALPNLYHSGREGEGPHQFHKEAVAGLQYPTELNQAFFAKDNLDRLQEEVRQRVYQASGSKQWVIDRQSDDEMKIIMRGVYLQNARHRVGETQQELAELNETVLTFAVKDVMTAVEHYMTYVQTLAEPVTPLDQPNASSMRGTKGSYQVENVRFF